MRYKSPRKLLFTSGVNLFKETNGIEDSIKVVKLFQPKFEFYKGIFKMPKLVVNERKKTPSPVMFCSRKSIMKSIECTRKGFKEFKEDWLGCSTPMPKSYKVKSRSHLGINGFRKITHDKSCTPTPDNASARTFNSRTRTIHLPSSFPHELG